MNDNELRTIVRQLSGNVKKETYNNERLFKTKMTLLFYKSKGKSLVKIIFSCKTSCFSVSMYNILSKSLTDK